MNIEKFKISNCKIDSDIKKIKDNSYMCIGKTSVGEDDTKLDSIFCIELNDEQYSYVNQFNYKEVLFDMDALIQARKNKKDIPYIYTKVSTIISAEEKVNIKKEKYKMYQKKAVADYKESLNKNRIKKSNKKTVFNFFYSWKDYIPGLEDNLIKMNLDKVKIGDKEHKKSSYINIEKQIKNQIVVIRPIEDSDEYELVLGYATFVRCKLLNLETNVYIVNKTREEFLKEIEELYNKSKQENDIENQNE